MAAGKFKPNCILVICNFLIRHGLITADKGVFLISVCLGCVCVYVSMCMWDVSMSGCMCLGVCVCVYVSVYVFSHVTSRLVM